MVPVHSPSYLFPQFMTGLFLVIYKLPLSVQKEDTLPVFLILPSPSLGSLLLSILSSGKDEPFPHGTHLKVGWNMCQGRIKPAPLTAFPTRTGPGTSAQA